MEKIVAQKMTPDVTVVSAVPFSEDLKAAWDQFIEYKAINATFLHSRKFYDHNPLNASEDASLIFYKNARIIAVFPAVLYASNGCRILHSHLRATYGGIVVSKDVNLEIAIQMIGMIISIAKNKNVNQIIVRNSFRIFHKNLCDETDFAMWFHGFEIKSRELEISVPISGSLEIIRSQYHRNTAQNVRKAKKSVEVNISNDFSAFWNVLEECLIERHNKKPVHDLQSIINLREKVGDQKILLFAAYYQNKFIGGAVVFNFADSVLTVQYLASDHNFQHLYPVHAIVNYLIEWGNKRGAKYLNLGTANEDAGKIINSGLFRFKESFGGRGVLRETMSLNL